MTKSYQNFKQTASRLSPEDPTILPRIVGSFEYYNALETLGELITISDGNELQVYDEMIAKRPEFSFYLGLSKKMWGEKVAFDTSEFLRINNANAVLDDDNENLASEARAAGLAWMMALARIELSANAAAYTTTKNAFAKLAPSEFEKQAYGILLMDDAVAHVLALKKDKTFRKLIRPRAGANAVTMDYWRRLKMVLAMIKAARESELNNSETEPYWKDASDDLERGLVALEVNIRSMLTVKNTTSTSTTQALHRLGCMTLGEAQRRGLIDPPKTKTAQKPNSGSSGPPQDR